ncbi:predicted protein [Histoplasma capsulatum G186AR]|uniref:Uncharacterized protein n=2 Tax=Ajellomyces capsulatus TaxID=5037 RepID=C0NR00_AJECG|nr:uncharacterized protein HCBG_05430 [Histoplasma capsulatum G186AR]EEH06114.1 predicted protein [Histoplasma capsulatum G186AR]
MDTSRCAGDASAMRSLQTTASPKASAHNKVEQATAKLPSPVGYVWKGGQSGGLRPIWETVGGGNIYTGRSACPRCPAIFNRAMAAQRRKKQTETDREQPERTGEWKISDHLQLL